MLRVTNELRGWRNWAIRRPLQHDVESSHHRVILVHHVVAVDRILAEIVSETKKDLHFFIGSEKHDVFLDLLVGKRPLNTRWLGRGDYRASQEDTELLQMDVDGMGPTLVFVDERPHLAVGRSCCAALLRTPILSERLVKFLVDIPKISFFVKSKFKMVRELSEVIPNAFEVGVGVVQFKDVS